MQDGATEYLAWFRRFWSSAEQGPPWTLGVEVPPLLRAAVTEGRVPDSSALHLLDAGRLRVVDGMLAFGAEQQGSWQWALRVDDLDHAAPPVFAGSPGKWSAEGCDLFEFLCFYAAYNRVHERPSTGDAWFIERSTIPTLKAAWKRHDVSLRSLVRDRPMMYWTKDDAVAVLLPDFDDDGDSIELGARTQETFDAAVKALGLDEDDDD